MECPWGSISMVTVRSWEEVPFALVLQLHSVCPVDTMKKDLSTQVQQQY